MRGHRALCLSQATWALRQAEEQLLGEGLSGRRASLAELAVLRTLWGWPWALGVQETLPNMVQRNQKVSENSGSFVHHLYTLYL